MTDREGGDKMRDFAGSSDDVEQESQIRVDGIKQLDPGNVIVFDLRSLAHFRDEGPSVQVLSDTGAARLVLFAFKAGQQLKEHRSSSQILVQVLRGRVTFRAGEQTIKLQAGMVLQVEANIPHTVLAQTNAVMLLTMTPSPAQHTLGLGREPAQELSPLVTRT
jgi:quercetin dioxygenase-like cupin family protein